MSDDAPPESKGDEGLPAWVMTFADLMSLLMCFFVLLLSFSEMDVAKYKQLAGSMKNAFGVQREIKVKDPPKGINVIAREFSPGRPEPTILNVVRQMTTNDISANLDLGKERRPPAPTPKARETPSKEKTIRPESPGKSQADGKKGEKPGQSEGLSESQVAALKAAKQAAAARLDEQMQHEKEAAEGGAAGQQDQKVSAEAEDSLAEKVRAADAAARRRKLEESARLISNALGKEIKAGSVDVETEGQKIIIRVREKASFGSGRAELKEAFRPLLDKVAKIIKGSEGQIVVAGHTDNLPIYTQRFRSNWELSSARAVSVVHEMMLATDIPSNRFLVEGYADTRPMVPNNSAENRAKNRRVEIILLQGEDKEAKDKTIGAEPEKTGTPGQGKVKKVNDGASAGQAAKKAVPARSEAVKKAREPSVSGKANQTSRPAPAGIRIGVDTHSEKPASVVVTPARTGNRQAPVGVRIGGAASTGSAVEPDASQQDVNRDAGKKPSSLGIRIGN